MNTTDKNNARTLADYHPAFKNFSWAKAILASFRKQDKKDEESGTSGNPYKNLEKASVLQEARTFNETPINARKCIQILTKIIYMINQGEQLGQTEATEIFFAMTKLFQSKDIMLRRMIYLSIKEMSTVANDVIIVTSSLTRDMTGKEDSHRGPAIQALCKITDASMMQSVERYMKQTIVDKLPSVALTSSVHLMRQSPEVVKRWVNEVQEAVNNDNIMVQYHELALLYQIRRTDKHTIRKLIVIFSKTALRSPYTFIRIAANLINEEGEGTDSPMYDFIDSCLRHKNEMIIYEAASTIVSLKCVTPKELSSALNVLQLFISSPKPVLRYAAVRTLNKRYDQHIDNRLKYTDGFKGIIFKALFDRLMPGFCLVDNYNSHVKSLSSGLDLEFLPLHIVSVLELKTKMKDSDVGQLLRYLRIILDYSPSSRSFILGAVTDFRDIRFAMVRRSTDDDDQFKYEASLKELQNRNGYLSHHLTMFFTADRSKFGFCRLEPLPDNIRIDNRLLGIGANAMVFSCSLINGQSNEYALKISNDSVQKEVSIYQQLYADKYRIVQVHSNAFLFLHPPGRVVSKENILNNAHLIWNQIKKAHQRRILHRDIRRSNIIEIFNEKINSNEILLIDWQSSMEFGSTMKYNGTLSTASKFILEELAKNRDSSLECLPVDDCVSFMKMILLELIAEPFKEALSSEVQQGSFSGILGVYCQMKKSWKKKPPILFEVIDFLEKHRQHFNEDKLNAFLDQCLENRQSLFQLDNQQTDDNYFNQLTRQIFPS
ncbi:unnamed protein product [Rotaria socialis]|uniref:Clathrin/coatomer adaptor adaptin-like N-terminal domain-containing protein n=1 Tax=Rotaria socialis TaxID=392032 RepID=A0A820WLX2_9BILA|nr:unnamed protein product [Rotaria socialis]CAF4519329.1 unnamed protein product [Rotaria socialis]